MELRASPLPISIDRRYGINAHNLGHEYFHTIQMGMFMTAEEAAGRILRSSAPS
jgi:hypothetical protein